MQEENRLTQSDDLGNWGVKGLLWKNLYVGNTITKEIHEILYGCLSKLKDYEETGFSPKEVEEFKDALAAEPQCKALYTIYEIVRSNRLDCEVPSDCFEQIKEVRVIDERTEETKVFKECTADDLQKMKDDWIPCSKKLPKPGKRYLVSGIWKDGDIYTFPGIYTAVYGKDGLWHTNNYEPIRYKVLAWQPLPEPYKEEQ